jgi:hypothetical protein
MASAVLKQITLPPVVPLVPRGVDRADEDALDRSGDWLVHVGAPTRAGGWQPGLLASVSSARACARSLLASAQRSVTVAA